MATTGAKVGDRNISEVRRQLLAKLIETAELDGTVSGYQRALVELLKFENSSGPPNPKRRRWTAQSRPTYLREQLQATLRMVEAAEEASSFVAAVGGRKFALLLRDELDKPREDEDVVEVASDEELLRMVEAAILEMPLEHVGQIHGWASSRLGGPRLRVVE